MVMRRLIFSLLLLLGVSSAAFAQQKVCYIFSQKVLEAMPEYKAAVAELEQMTKTARENSDLLFEEAKEMFNEFQQYQDRMSEAQYNRYKQMVIDKEKAANDYEEKMFGENGEIAKRQKELMEPIEAKLMVAVNAYAEKHGYDMIYDMSLIKVTIYQSPKLDVTNEIINVVIK